MTTSTTHSQEDSNSPIVSAYFALLHEDVTAFSTVRSRSLLPFWAEDCLQQKDREKSPGIWRSSPLWSRNRVRNHLLDLAAIHNLTFEEIPHTSYVEVDEEQGVNLFYYFIKSEKTPAEDPLLYFIVGGPGCSALNTLALEIGKRSPILAI